MRVRRGSTHTHTRARDEEPLAWLSILQMLPALRRGERGGEVVRCNYTRRARGRLGRTRKNALTQGLIWTESKVNTSYTGLGRICGRLHSITSLSADLLQLTRAPERLYLSRSPPLPISSLHSAHNGWRPMHTVYAFPELL